MRPLVVLSALLMAAPVAANAQDATERRRQLNIDNLRAFEQNQRIGEIERRVTDMEIRTRSDESLRALQPSTAPVNDNPYAVIVSTSRPVPGRLSPEDAKRDAELAASNARLREIAAGQRGR